MTDIKRIHEKYYSAVIGLAAGTESLRQRVVSAYEGSANRVNPGRPVSPGLGVSEELASRINEIHQRMTAKGTFEASVEAMTDEEVQAVAEEMFGICMASVE